MSGGVDAAARRTSRWRIEARSENGQDVFDVYQGERRVAWGLSDRAAAERWVRRLGGAPVAAGGAPAPRRVWWEERDATPDETPDG